MKGTRLLRLKTAATAAFGLITITFLFCQSFQSDLGFTLKHNNALLQANDMGLEMPLDPVPRQDFSVVSQYAPQNIDEPSKFAFATFYCSRNTDPRDPYFESTQSVIWRLLWSNYRSKYPVIVFVCPFIPEQNRRILRGQGAIVKEIDLIENIIPDEVIPLKRWVDVLTKLNVWKEVEWQRIALLDCDAFPIRNNDDIFDIVQEQQCNKDALTPEDAAVVNMGGKDMCTYVYAGVEQFVPGNVNAGLLVLKPNLDMHAKLMQAAKRTTDYDVSDMEQGVLGSKNAFAADGPFPVWFLPPIWNAWPAFYQDFVANNKEAIEGPIRILHVRMWDRFWGAWNNLTHLNDMWDIDWMTMCRFYDSDYFVEARRSGIYETAAERFMKALSKESTE